jgi:hypothetical protein
MGTMKTLLRKGAALPAFPTFFVLSLALAQAPCGHAQTQAQPNTQATVDAPASPEGSVAGVGGISKSPAQVVNLSDPEISPAVAKALAAMQARIAQLEAELKAHTTEQRPAAAAVAPNRLRRRKRPLNPRPPRLRRRQRSNLSRTGTGLGSTETRATKT